MNGVRSAVLLLVVATVCGVAAFIETAANETAAGDAGSRPHIV